MKFQFTILCGLLFCVPFLANNSLASKSISIDAYYSGLNAEKAPNGSVDPSVLQPEQIDYQAFSTLTYYGIVINADLSLYWPRSGQVCGDVAGRTVKLAHAAGRKVIVSVGADPDPGETHNSRFRTSVSDSRRAQFISGLLQIVSDCDFDGIDLDWEPLLLEDGPAYTKFIHDLRAALDLKGGSSRHMLLTAATGSESSKIFAPIQGDFDLIKLMTYDLAWEGQGAPLWHNSALFSGKMPPGQDPVTSADSEVKEALAAGIAPEKLDIAIDFYGFNWTNKDKSEDQSLGLPYPKQVWKAKADIDEDVSYADIMNIYYKPEIAHWDDEAKSPYLSLISPEGYPEFITYDDARACQEKIGYALEKGLYGVFIWDLGGEWRPGNAVPNELLEVVKKAAFPASPASE